MLRILLCSVVGLCGCAKNPVSERVVSITAPQSLATITDQKTSAGFEKILSEFEIRPQRGLLSAEEMLNLTTIFLQIDALAEADEMGVVYLPSSSDLFYSLDSSLTDTPGWRVLQHRAHSTGKIELFSVSAFIEASQLYRPKKR